MERSDLGVSSTYQSEYGLTTTTEFQRTSSSNSNPVLTQHVGDTRRNRHNWSLWSQHRVSLPTLQPPLRIIRTTATVSTPPARILLPTCCWGSIPTMTETSNESALDRVNPSVGPLLGLRSGLRHQSVPPTDVVAKVSPSGDTVPSSFDLGSKDVHRLSLKRIVLMVGWGMRSGDGKCRRVMLLW